MPTMTLLEMTQNILSAMSSDEVNSISDTVESLQVAEEIRNTYYDQFATRDFSRNKGLVNLEATDATTPHIMTIPDDVVAVEWIKYRNHRLDDLQFNDVEYVQPEEFVKRFVEMPASNFGHSQDVELLPTSPLVYPIANNKAPSYYTILDQNRQLVFDSFDVDAEDFLTSSNAIAWGTIMQEFVLEDDFVPPLPPNLFPHLLAESKSACFVNYKEISNPVEIQRARRQSVRNQTVMDATTAQQKGWADSVNYGRHRR